MIWETISSWDASTVAEVVGATVALVGAVVGAAMWILRWFGRRRTQRLLEKRVGSKLYASSILEQSTRYYVEPDCSIVDPAREEEIRNVRAPKEKAFAALDDFFDKDSVYRHMIILADSGMGKTSLLLNYFVHNYKRRNPRKIKLLPLGIPNLAELIKEVETPEDTTIFLDAFDEDTKAIVDHKERLRELMELCQRFDRVVITCRTQFFLDDEEIPRETGILRIGPRSGGEGATYTFQKLYLMPLSDPQITKYLRKRYSIWQWFKRRDAQSIVEKIPLLSVRPMLLTHIPDLLNQETKIEYSFELYEAMIQAWLQRERGWVEPDNLRSFSERLAVDIFVNRSERGAERLPREELNELLKEWRVPLNEQEISGRSLLNRDADGNLKFAHRSIMEYLFLCCNFSGLKHEWATIILSDQMGSFIKEALQSQQLFWIKNLPNADLREADLSNADLRGADLRGASLQAADLSKADLGRAVLRFADLREADLRGTNLQAADLSNARYNSETQWSDGFVYRNSGAIGPNANLRFADLSNADLSNADLSGADLSNAVLKGADLSGARYNSATKWPDGFDYRTSGAIVR